MSQQTYRAPPPQKKTVEGGYFLLYRCLVFPKKVLRGKPVLFGNIQVKIFEHIHSNQILMNLALFDNNESAVIQKISMRPKRCTITISIYIRVM